MTSGTVALSKRLSWLLRHGAGEAGLPMDQAGWSQVNDVLAVLGITKAQLDLAVANNDKGRLVVEGGRVRACQGHSLANMPVTREALEASWQVVPPETPLWHGTKVAAVEGIARDGIVPGLRSHVHLAEAPDSRVGKRSLVDFLVEVSPALLAQAGVAVFRSQNGVLLVRHVPRAAIAGLRPTSRAGLQAEKGARQLLGLAPTG
ncbi:MAG TPA: RNA 2'-phosphotransferase [Acidimicrobiales bacterium]|nr:RNA 2'-phosphotransferase [Acidimicrobiales bacterium]